MRMDAAIAIIDQISAVVSIDWIIITTVWVVILIDALRSGTTRAATLVVTLPISLYVADMLDKTFFVGPFVFEFMRFSPTFMQAGLFGVIVIVLALLMFRIVSLSPRTNTTTTALIASLIAAVVLVVVWIQVPALQVLWHFGPQVESIFGIAYALYWILAGYVLMAFVRS